MQINDFRKLLSEAKKQNHPYYPIWAMMGMTGIRNAEAKALQWSDVDLENKTILIKNTISKVSSSIIPLQNIREIPLEKEAQEVLEDLKKVETTDFVFPRIKSWLSDKGSIELKKFLHKIGLGNITLNSFRQLYATRFLQKLSEKEIEKNLALLNHKSSSPYRN